MRLINRKAGVEIGLTVILTFPVTVVSGAGSQKKGETETRVIRTIYTVPADRTGNGEEGGPSLIQVPADHVGTSSRAVTVHVHSPASPDRAQNQ
jgi:hypothetical protein